MIKKAQINFILAGLLVVLGNMATAANIPLKLIRAGSNSWEQMQYKNFIGQTQSVLPESFKNVLQDEDIEIEFDPLSNKIQSISQIDVTCLKQQKNDGEESSLKERIFTAGTTSQLPFSKRKILLNSLLWTEILRGPTESHQYSCGHRTGYRLAMATLIHELGHAYDDERKISTDRRFMHLMTFSPGILGATQKNDHAYRSADLYELTSPKEAFAVNLEYFIMDPEFKCRRPVLYQYYKEKIKFEPYKNKACAIDRNVIVTGFEQRKASLDETRLYRIDYLLADKGSAFESKFGHSMLRLVFCAPGKPKSNACLTDAAHHVVVSFRANPTENRKADVKETEASIWDRATYALKGLGIYGRFPSEMFLLSMPMVVTEYNQFDFRDLVSSPLNLTELEKRDFLNRVLEIYWGYSGSYKFFTNNCRTETEDLLKAIIRSENIENVNATTPVGLREELYDNGFAFDNAENKELRHRSIHYYTRETLTDIANIFDDHGRPVDPAGITTYLSKADPDDRKTLETYANEFSADQRRLFILSLKNHYDAKKFEHLSVKKYTRLLNNVISIELAAFAYQRMKTYFYRGSFYNHLFRGDPKAFSSYLKPNEFEKFSKELEKFKHILLLRQQGQSELTAGYGIPLRKDWTRPNTALIPELGFELQTDIKVEKKKSASSFELQILDLLEEVTGDEVVQFETDRENLRLLRDISTIARKNILIPAADGSLKILLALSEDERTKIYNQDVNVQKAFDLLSSEGFKGTSFDFAKKVLSEAK